MTIEFLRNVTCAFIGVWMFLSLTLIWQWVPGGMIVYFNHVSLKSGVFGLWILGASVLFFILGLLLLAKL